MSYVVPIVIELGDVADTDLEALTGGTGGVSDEVEEVMRIVRKRYAESGEKRTLVPVVAVYTAISGR